MRHSFVDCSTRVQVQLKILLSSLVLWNFINWPKKYLNSSIKTTLLLYPIKKGEPLQPYDRITASLQCSVNIMDAFLQSYDKITASLQWSVSKWMLYRIPFEYLSVVSIPLGCFFVIVCPSVIKITYMGIALFHYSDTHFCNYWLLMTHIYVICYICFGFLILLY